MARRRRIRRYGLGSTACRLPAGMSTDKCMTEGKVTLCVGDRVTRPSFKAAGTGTVLAVHYGADNSGRKKKAAARVCFDTDAAGDLAYPYHFTELRKK